MDDYIGVLKKELSNRNYSRRTVSAYIAVIKKFLMFTEANNYDPRTRIMEFLNNYGDHNEQKRIAYQAIKIFYSFVIKKDCPYLLTKIRVQKRLPNVISRNDILKILSVIKNTQHKLIISMLYGSGLRVSEVIKIKIEDINFDDKKLFVRKSKNNKDRITLFSDIYENDIKKLFDGKNMKNYLFLTRNNKKYSVRTVQKIFDDALILSQVNKKATCHTLRHSFATHLLQNGVDIKTIMHYLGHESIKTTSIYLHISSMSNNNTKSPL